MSKLLIVDDEIKIREMIEKYALHEGYEVVTAKDGEEALKVYATNDFDVIIMDIMMPGMDGYTTFQRLKDIKETPCIFLSALSQEEDRLYCFDIGGVDYLSKPFSMKELMMRISVVLNYKAGTGSNNRLLVCDGLKMDEQSRIVTIDGERISLSLKEYELLRYFLMNQGVALRREDILAKVWGYEDYSDDRTLDTHIKMLRKALGEYAHYIVTIRGVGYRFEKEV